MPRLHAFIICDKVIIDDAGTASLISLFNTITAQIPEGISIPSNAVAPREWAIFLAWDWIPEDAGITYKQLVEILYPDESVFGRRIEARFMMEPHKRHQLRFQAHGFPIGQTGTYAVKMWLERDGREVHPPESNYITVNYNVVPNVQPAVETKIQ